MVHPRRHFVQQLAAGVLLAPFLPLVSCRSARAATAGAPRRLIVMTSLGTAKALWTPQQPAGAALQLPPLLAPLSAVAADLVLLDGLSFAYPAEGHSTPQPLTGKGFATAYGTGTDSVDQYIAAKTAGAQRLPSLLLGWQAKGEAHFWQNGRRLTTLDNPSDAWQSAFGGAMASGGAQAMTAADASRQRIWTMVEQEVAAFAKGLTGDNKARVTDHAESMAKLLSRASAPALSGTCTVPRQPNLGVDASADSSEGLVSAAHIDLITAALACDVTRVVGMQFGVSNRQYLAGSVNDDEHSAVHSGTQAYPQLIAAENALCNWVVKLCQALKATPDPLAPGTSLFANTLILWSRDIADGPQHTQYSMPYALLGGGSYLSKSPNGRYLNLGGDDASRQVGTPHQRLLLNLIDYMGAGSGVDFGTVAALSAADRLPLPQIKA